MQKFLKVILFDPILVIVSHHEEMVQARPVGKEFLRGRGGNREFNDA